MSIKFSIVTCTWNSEKYLPQTLESIRSQTYANFEVIFVDGGSDDQTLRQIEFFGGNKTVLTDVRGGIANAMNRGIEAAQGDVIIHLHSDDYFLHAKVLERVASVFSENDCQWIFGRILNDRSGGLFPETYIPPKYSYRTLLRSNIVPHAATFVRRDLYERAGGFNESLKFAMDYDMWLRLGLMAEPCQLFEALSVFRRHDGSTTEANRMGSFDEDYRVRCAYLTSNSIDKFEHALRYQWRRRRLISLLNSAKVDGAL